MQSTKLFAALAVGALAIGATAPAMADDVYGAAPALSGVPDLSAGMVAPTLDVGTESVSKATVSYSNSIGNADSFSVGALTNIGANASASSTPDYNVTSSASFSINASTVNQVIGTSAALPSALTDISGSFSKAYTPDTIDNDVTVSGIGTDAAITASSATFTSDIVKAVEAPGSTGDLLNTGCWFCKRRCWRHRRYNHDSKCKQFSVRELFRSGLLITLLGIYYAII